MAHNGKLIQINMPDGGSQGCYPYLNCMKSGGGWYDLPAANMNAQGYPTCNASVSGANMTINMPSQAQRPGNYVYVWNGTHGVGFSGASTVSGSPSTGSNRWVFTPPSGTSSFTVTGNDFSTMTTPSTDSYVCHVDDEAALLSGEIFQTKFLGLIAEAGVIRFMQAQAIPVGSQSTWSTRKDLLYAWWDGYEYRSSIYCGVTTSTGDAYSAALSGFTLTDKATVHVKWDHSATTDAVTLNVNSTGAKSVLTLGGGALDSGYRPEINKVVTLVYSALLGGWCKFGDAFLGYQGLNNGWPPEAMVALCNKVNAHMWVCTPYLAYDPITDWVNSMCTYAKNNLNAGLKIFVEVNNEVWNGALAYQGTQYANNASTALWGSEQYPEWYGKALSETGQAVSAVFNGDRSKYEVVCGVQAHGVVSDSIPKLTATNYVTINGGQPAYKWATKVAPANYYNPGLTDSEQMAAAYAYSLGDTSQADVVAQSTFNDGTTGNASFAIPNTKRLMDHWFNFGMAYGIPLCFYEGGYTPYFLDNDMTASISAVTKAANAVVTISGTDPVPVAGMTMSFSGVSGMTQLNGNSYTVVSVAGQNVTINVNSTGFSTYTSGGTATYVNSKTQNNNLATAARSSSYLRTAEYTMFSQCVRSGGVFPACYEFSGGELFSVWIPDTYASPTPPRWLGMQDFNNNGPATFYGRLR